MAFENQKGLIALHQNRLEDAETCFRNALGRDPDDPMAWAGLGRALPRCQNFQEAIAAARRALALQREMPFAHLTIAQASEELGEPDASALAYAEALRLEPNLMNSRAGLLRLHPAASVEMQERVLSHVTRSRTDKPTGLRQRQAGNATAILDQIRSDYRKKIATKRAAESPVEVYHFRTRLKPGSSGKEFLIVSGLPRSGTSMLMQMLARGGMEPMTDGVREADTDNPKGYYEWEGIKRLGEKPDVIEQAGERPVKVISAQLRHLPREHVYRVIFILRPVAEIARSQQAMLDRLGKAGGDQGLQETATALARHEKTALEQLHARPETKVLELNYHETIEDPEKTARLLQAFFGADKLTMPENMTRAVDASLHRQRTHA